MCVCTVYHHGTVHCLSSWYSVHVYIPKTIGCCRAFCRELVAEFDAEGVKRRKRRRLRRRQYINKACTAFIVLHFYILSFLTMLLSLWKGLETHFSTWIISCCAFRHTLICIGSTLKKRMLVHLLQWTDQWERQNKIQNSSFKSGLSNLSFSSILQSTNIIYRLTD